MNSRRTIILLVAVVAGAFAAFGLTSYIRNVENTAGEAGASQEIWVVTAPIPKGTSGEEAVSANLIGTQRVAESLVSPTAVNNPTTELAGLVAVADLDVNMPLVSGFFASPSVVQTGVADRLEERGLVTVSINVDQARGAAHLIEPGDRVNVMVERPWDLAFYEQDPAVQLTEEARETLVAQLEESDTARPILNDLYPVDVRFVYQAAEVLAIGDAITPDIGDDPAAEEVAIDRGLVTLAVPPEAAQTILSVGRENIYLSLVPADYQPRPIQPGDPTSQVLPGEVEGTLTPYDEAEAAGFLSDLAYSDGESRIGDVPSQSTNESLLEDYGTVPPTTEATETTETTETTENTGE